MPIAVHQFPCLSDNYGFLGKDEATGLAACIDTPGLVRVSAGNYGGRLGKSFVWLIPERHGG